MAFGLFIARVVVGLLLFGHGAQKLFGWFGGHGPEATAGWLRSIGYRRSRVMAIAAGLGEALGGGMLALGFLTPLASAAIIGVMLNAIVAVHLPKGVWNEAGGYELPLTNAVVAGAIAFTGPGRWSIDALIGFAPDHVTGGVLALALGIVSAALTLGIMRERQPSAAELGAARAA